MVDRGSGARLILNVNDTESTLYLVGRILRSEGYAVLEAKSGQAAIELAAEKLPALVVLDIKLPDMSGYEVAHRLKSDPRTAHIPILATSATFVTAESRSLGLDSGADAYLTQPFESLELIALVDALLRGKHHEAEALAKAAALEDADHRKDEFLAMLAHELRNPLGAIVAAASLLDGDAEDDGTRLDPARRRQLTGTIQRQARHLASMVDDLLDVSRITHGKITLRRRIVDLRGCVDGVAHGMQHVFSRKKQRFVVRKPDGDAPVCVDADPTRIEQVLQNLLNNASKYTNEGGTVTLVLEDRDGDGGKLAHLRVTDSGIGIEPQHISAIFDLFYQVEPTLARSASGLGIGLTMVRQLVAMHGGTVRARSDGKDRGTEVIVELPIVDRPAEDAGAPTQQHDGRPRRVLLVDDNVESSEILQLALRAAGHDADVAHDGEQGLSMAAKGAYEVAVLDIGLPILDGYQVAERLVQTLGDKRPRLIALTGYGRAEDREKALRAGFDEHYVKPIDLDVLERAIGGAQRR